MSVRSPLFRVAYLSVRRFGAMAPILLLYANGSERFGILWAKRLHAEGAVVVAFVGPTPAGEVAAQTLASTQALLGTSGLGELGQIGASGVSTTVGNLLISQAIARNALLNLGLFGP